MRKRGRNLGALLVATIKNWNAHNCLRLGASLSYYTLFSLFPLILIVLTVARLVLVNSEIAQGIILNALDSVTGGLRKDFEEALETVLQTRRGSGVFGTITLLLGASWVFGELVSAFNIIWGVQPPTSGGPFQFLKSTFFSFALVLAGAFLLLVSMILSSVLAALNELLETLPGGNTVWGITNIAINLLVLALVFALLFKFLPQTRVAWSDVWLGAVLTAIVWTLLQFAISWYIGFSGYANYGPVGATLALVAWVYLSSQVLFIGGEFTAAYADFYGSRAHHERPEQVPAGADQPVRLQ
jgi:membrane protein